MFDFRGVMFDVDPEFANSEEWYEAIPEACARPRTSPSIICSPRMPKCGYVAYVSQQNLVVDESDEPVDHPAIARHVRTLDGGRYRLKPEQRIE